MLSKRTINVFLSFSTFPRPPNKPHGNKWGNGWWKTRDTWTVHCPAGTLSNSGVQITPSNWWVFCLLRVKKKSCVKACWYSSGAGMSLYTEVQIFFFWLRIRLGVLMPRCNNFLTKYTLSWWVPAPGCGGTWTSVFCGDNGQGVKGDSRIFQGNTGWRQPCL